MRVRAARPVRRWLQPILAVVVAGLFCSNPIEADDKSPRGFQVLVWQYKTDAIRDRSMYERVNIDGFHIDYGEGQKSRADWAAENGKPYYVDHAAGKGILHLTPRSGLDEIARDGSRSPRPWSVFDPATLDELRSRLDRNVPPVANGPVVAIALDDEVSLGTFNSPLEVDFSEAAVRAFRQFVRSEYPSEAALRNAWGSHGDGEIEPATYEEVRRQLTDLPPNRWRLAPWMDFRAFMDSRQSDVFGELVRHTNGLAPGVPAGVVGGQQPSTYGGFDYSKLRHSLQFIESYDIGGTNEILHSFWSSAPRKPRMQTYFAAGNLRADQWFLWYYLAHGCRGVIVWPDRGGKLWFDGGQVDPHVEALADTFAAVRDDRLSVLVDKATEPLFSPIAVLYSHPSVQVGWAIDASAHGKTWPRRSSSLDNRCLSSGKNRIAWTRLLEDLGHQPRIVDPVELVDGLLERDEFKVLVLPQAFALSRSECDAIRRFADAGGTVIADYGTAIVDEHGTGYERSPLDELFGIDRSTDRGWFDGVRYEIDGERYQRPFAERLSSASLTDDGSFRPIEASVDATIVKTRVGSGEANFLNTSPTGYYDSKLRSGDFGKRWRLLIGETLSRRGAEPAVNFRRVDGRTGGVELLRYRNGDREVWVFVPNPTRQAAVDGAGSGLALEPGPIEVELGENGPFRNLRTGEVVGSRLQIPATEAVAIEPMKP